MFEWLFPTWSNPDVVAAVVAVRLVSNAALTGIVARARGPGSVLTATGAVATVGSTVVMVLVLRPGGLGHGASLVDLVVQVGMLALLGYAVHAAPSHERIVAALAVAVCVLAVLVLLIPLYGEATVAP